MLLKSKKQVAVIIPTYNEKENLQKLVSVINTIFIKNKIEGTIIVVDDNSPDGTGVLAHNLAKHYPLKVVHRHKNKGYGNSVLEGFKTAIKIKSDIIITMDCDFSHSPDKIPELIQSLNQRYDVVIGSRRVESGKIMGWSLWRHFCSSGASWFSRFILNMKTKDITSGFRAYNREVIEHLLNEKIRSNGYSFLEEILYSVEKKKYKIKEIPIVFVDRKFGKSKLSKKEIVKFFITLLNIKLAENMQFFKFISVGFFGIIVNMFFLWLFQSIVLLPLFISGLIAIELSIISNFILNNSWSFKHLTPINSFFRLIQRFGKYHLAVFLGVIINYSVLLILSEYFGVHYLISNFIGILFSTLSNYLISSRWVWGKK